MFCTLIVTSEHIPPVGSYIEHFEVKNASISPLPGNRTALPIRIVEDNPGDVLL